MTTITSTVVYDTHRTNAIFDLLTCSLHVSIDIFGDNASEFNDVGENLCCYSRKEGFMAFDSFLSGLGNGQTNFRRPSEHDYLLHQFNSMQLMVKSLLRHGECSAPIPLFQPFAPRVPVLIPIRSFSRFVAIASVIVTLPKRWCCKIWVRQSESFFSCI